MKIELTEALVSRVAAAMTGSMESVIRQAFNDSAEAELLAELNAPSEMTDQNKIMAYLASTTRGVSVDAGTIFWVTVESEYLRASLNIVPERMKPNLDVLEVEGSVVIDEMDGGILMVRYVQKDD